MVAVAPRSPLWPPPLPLRLYSTVMAAAEQPSTTAHGMTPDGGEQQQLQPQPELQAQGEGQAPQQAKQSPRGRKKKEWQGPLAYHQELTLQVDSLTNLGMGVCRFELEGTGERWVVMVPAVIPGEVVRVKIYRNHKNYSQADLLEVLEPSPDRVEPTCPVRGWVGGWWRGRLSDLCVCLLSAYLRAAHQCLPARFLQLFGTCGGCQYQHMRVPAQRAWKQQHVEEVLTRTGNITGSDMRPVNEVFGTSEVLGYRSKITPHHEKPRSVSLMEENAAGNRHSTATV